MRQHHRLFVGVLFGIVVLGGCASEQRPTSSAMQQETARTAMDYRKLATELREMARRRELEAEVMAKQDNPDQQRIAQKREMAQELLKEALAADQRAQEMQRQVPHGMIQ